jgi:hypothetical protein
MALDEPLVRPTYLQRMWELIHFMQAHNLQLFQDVPANVIEEIKQRFPYDAEEQVMPDNFPQN